MSPSLDGASTRGSLSITDKVVEKTAAQILTGLPDIGGPSTGFFPLTAKANPETRPSVEVRLSGRSCALVVHLGLAYPTPIAEATEQVRTHLSSQVEHLTGVSVRQVDIVVRRFIPAPTGSRRGAGRLQ